VSDFDRPDPKKDRLNLAQHGMSLHEAERFDFDTAEIEEDTRARYGEQRFNGIGRLHNGPIVVFAFTYRGDKVRAISLRKATPKERRKWLEKG
jgi:uncharacterized DUF497 family protein